MNDKLLQKIETYLKENSDLTKEDGFHFICNEIRRSVDDNYIINNTYLSFIVVCIIKYPFSLKDITSDGEVFIGVGLDKNEEALMIGTIKEIYKNIKYRDILRPSSICFFNYFAKTNIQESREEQIISFLKEIDLDLINSIKFKFKGNEVKIKIK